VGFNHHFGHNREGDYDYLHELGKFYEFSVEEIPEQDIHNEFVSSTKIRKAILEGNIQRANAYLDHEYFIIAPIKAVADIRQPDGFNWFEVFPEEAEKQITPPGVYAGSIVEADCRIKVMVYIVEDASGLRILLYAAAFDLSTIHEVNLSFHKKIRLTRTGEGGLSRDYLFQDLEEIMELIY
jgi:FAD synthase